ncbi:MAG: AMP-binding protein [Bdellovibrio sp.]|nr:AMP-binding protein [Bdellovibrio sp.]
MDAHTSSDYELDWLKRWNQYAPRSLAITDGDTALNLTYAQLYQQSCAGATYLKENFGIKAGDRILHFSTNEMSSFVLFFALARLGATLVPINYRLTGREVSYIITNAEPTLLVYEESFLGLLKEIENEIPIKSKDWLALVGKNSFQSATIQTKKLFTEFHSSSQSTALIIYTSGTTGFPKGAMISHQMLFWNSINTTLRLNIAESDSAVIFLPLFHTGGWNVLSTPFLHRGAHIILTKKFEAEQILTLSEQHSATLLFGVPTTMAMMSRTEKFKTVDLSSLRYAICGGEPMPLEQIDIWQKKNVPIRQGYGLTEFGPNVFSLNEEDSIRKMGSIGFPNFYVDVCVVDENKKYLGANEIGELWLKGPMSMTGYWKNPKATEETFFEGWLQTGDLVYFDDENYFYVVGRKKDMYKSGGENVYPAEIEQVIQQLPWILEVAVIGIKDEQWGEVGHAYIVAKNDLFNEVELRAHCSQNLAKFKNPKFFTAMKELPKGDSGKILKRKLTEQA